MRLKSREGTISSWTQSSLYRGLLGSWVGRIPNLRDQLICPAKQTIYTDRFLMVTRCRENLSSGLNRAAGE